MWRCCQACCWACAWATPPPTAQRARLNHHAFTLGFILGEIVRRVDGRTVGAFFQDEVAKPLGLDCWIGLPEELESRVAPSTPFDISVIDPTSGLLDAFAPGTLLGKLFGNIGEWVERWDSGSPTRRSCRPPVGSRTGPAGRPRTAPR